MDEKENTVKNKGHKKNMALKQIVKQPNGQKEATEASLKPEVIEKRSITNRVNSAIRKEITPLMTEYIRERIFSPVGENGEPYFKAYVSAEEMLQV